MYLFFYYQMLSHISTFSELNEIYWYAGVITVLIVFYIGYLAAFKGAVFKSIGNYDQRKKNIGRPLPAYPNGWYIVLHSKKLEKGKS
jgi:hypothetical protein